MSLLNRTVSGRRGGNRLLEMEGRSKPTRLSTTPSSGGRRVDSGRRTTLIDQYFDGIEREWARRTGQKPDYSGYFRR